MDRALTEEKLENAILAVTGNASLLADEEKTYRQKYFVARDEIFKALGPIDPAGIQKLYHIASMSLNDLKGFPLISELCILNFLATLSIKQMELANQHDYSHVQAEIDKNLAPVKEKTLPADQFAMGFLMQKLCERGADINITEEILGAYFGVSADTIAKYEKLVELEIKGQDDDKTHLIMVLSAMAKIETERDFYSFEKGLDKRHPNRQKAVRNFYHIHDQWLEELAASCLEVTRPELEKFEDEVLRTLFKQEKVSQLLKKDKRYSYEEMLILGFTYKLFTANNSLEKRIMTSWIPDLLP